MISMTIVAVTFFSSLLVLLVLIPLAPGWNLMDHPGGRKDHVGRTPVVGGLSIGLVFVAALFYFQTNAWWVLKKVTAIIVMLIIGTL